MQEERLWTFIWYWAMLIFGYFNIEGVWGIYSILYGFMRW